ncbi:MAG TPA: cysteine--tRNA ligase [Candidatus Gastranaerophilales bacterium]|nr:cysteine--tRNA ligase [Candidatus Gastranaerophilales bacterium]
MKVFDTQSQTLKEFSPLDDNKVKMYVCGPTVYDYPHLGHARCYITWDVVYRYLKFRGYDVTYVRNITDIDDKIINKALQTGFSTKEIADKYYFEFEKAMNELNTAKPDIEPKATENIEEMIDIIKTLCEKGFAYPADGDVYFNVANFKKYGRLSKQNLEDLKSGARVEASEKKQNPFDFALWKAVKDETEPGWNSPWGKGRPGWHIECSAMSKKFLGETIDIHAGGQDLIFPHHENEKAQSEAAFGKDFVKYWMHNGFVKINEEKMSKSLGNYITIGDVLKKYDANTIRFFILTNHYRMPVEFGDQALESAKNGIKRLKNAYEDIKTITSEEKIKEAENIISFLFDEVAKTEHIPFHGIDSLEEAQGLEKKIPPEIANSLILSLKNFINAMDDDFNTPKALSVLFEIAGRAQKIKQSDSAEFGLFYIAMLLKLSNVLGFDLTKEEKASDELASQLMDVIINLRQISREQKNWEMSDRIRDELVKIGITLKDHKDKKTTWSLSD